MSSAVNYDKILDKTADELFEEYSVEDVGRIMTKLSDDVTDKKQKLKFLVGSKYRDLLNVADDIIKMNSITTLENDQLMKLAFKKSNYNSKSLSNLSKFNSFIQQSQINKVQIENRPIIFKNAVHDLNYSLISLKNNLLSELQPTDDDNDNRNNDEIFNAKESNEYSNFKKFQMIDLDESLDNYQPVSSSVSNGFVLIAKTIYLIKYYFDYEIKHCQNLFATTKYNQLCNEFNNLLDSNIVILKHDVDIDFVLSLFISKVIANKQNPIEVIQWILNNRLKYFENLINTAMPFQELLNYIFITVEFINFIDSRISVTMNRLKNHSGINNWINQTSFQKWAKWLNNNFQTGNKENDINSQLEYNFELENDMFVKSDIDEIINNWRIRIGKLLILNFDKKFEKSYDDLSSLVTLLRYILISFKHFTSLCDLPVNNENIVNFILKKWSNEYFTLLTKKLTRFEDISHLIFKTFDDVNLIKKIYNSSIESNLFQFKDNFNLNSLLQLSKNKYSNDEVFNLLDNFKQDLKSTGNSIESLKILSSLVLKPLLTIDDYEDDRFWNDISEKLNCILNKSVSTNVSILNKSIQLFFDRLSKLLETKNKENLNMRIFYIMRVLVQLEEKIQLNEFYETFSKYSNESIDKRINLSELIEPILENYFNVIINSIYKNGYNTKIQDLLKERFNSEKEYSEFILWEQISENKYLPTMCSIEYTEFLLSFCDDLSIINNNNYSYMYTLKSFENSRTTILENLSKEIQEFIKGLEKPEKEKLENFNLKILLTYSDYIYTKLLSNPEFTGDLFVDKLNALYSEMEDSKYREQIVNSISEYFKNQSLIYYPLSK